ncbi:hypothetical protein ACWGLE_07525 [Streptomyces sp. NPDC055897]
MDLAEPAVGAGLADTFAEVLDDLDEPGSLAWVDLEDGQRMQASLNLYLILVELMKMGCGKVLGCVPIGWSRQQAPPGCPRFL